MIPKTNIGEVFVRQNIGSHPTADCLDSTSAIAEPSHQHRRILRVPFGYMSQFGTERIRIRPVQTLGCNARRANRSFGWTEWGSRWAGACGNSCEEVAKINLVNNYGAYTG